jgi:phosphoglycolate phosphatase-like HAD superfamily hydrolase
MHSIVSPPPLLHKAALLDQLLTDTRLAANQCAYVGDRAEDHHAARANQLRFFWAAWGFGAAGGADTIGADAIRLDRPEARRLLSPP